jgi:CRP-like cAMP-binding protein
MSFGEIIRGAPLFAGLSERELATVLAAGLRRSLSAGETIFAQNSEGRDLYVLLAGAVDIVMATRVRGLHGGAPVPPRLIAQVRPGESFGEMALVTGQPRSASAIAAVDGTEIFSVPPELVEQLSVEVPAVGHSVFRHLSSVMARVVRTQTSATMDAVMRDYFVQVLAEELAGEVAYCDPTTPIEKTVTIRDPASYILAKLTGGGGPSEKETFRFVVFAYLSDLAVFGEGEPAGFHVLEYIFSLLRDGAPPAWLPPEPFEHRLGEGGDRRNGVLGCRKRRGEHETEYFLRWEVKGLGDPTSPPTVCLYVSTEDEAADARHMDSIVHGIEMPIQRFLSQAVPEQVGKGFRVLTVHHRTPEVAHTLESLARHGFQLDSYIGIPYGDTSWIQARMLDHVSGRRYYCLTAREHPIRPTTYLFDFGRSSFQAPAAERDLLALFEGERASCGYLEAMTRLCTLRLARALEMCAAEGSRLLVYEDGAYVIPIVYAAYAEPAHPLHSAVREAVDGGLLVGVVEVTTAGERRNRAVIEQNQGVAILPVLSCALEDIKLIYEGLGVAEAVIHAASTAFGNLGLPTFAARRPAVLGGNGAIGARLVEQLVSAHNSTANVFVVDIAEQPFGREIDETAFPHAATRLGYKPIRRFFVGPRCLAVTLDRPFVGERAPSAPWALEPRIASFFASAAHDELALSNVDDSAREWLAAFRASSGYLPAGQQELPEGVGWRLVFARGDERKQVTLLRGSVVFAYRSLAPLLHAGVDTVIGATGFEAFQEADFDAFLAREPGPDRSRVDTLALLSASSKDYEFKRLLTLLARLVALLHGGASVDDSLAWFADFHRQGRLFVASPDGAEVNAILDAAGEPSALAAKLAEHPDGDVAQALRGLAGPQLRAGLAAHLRARLRGVLTLRKEVRPDVGLLYHLTYRGQPKRLVLLANGLVVNFFARYEKGVKTEYIDPIVTMQMLGLVQLATRPVPNGLHRIEKYIERADVTRLWEALEARCRPLELAP